MKRCVRGRVVLAAAILFGWMTSFVYAAPETAAEADLKIQAKSAVLLDAGTGTFLYEQNSHEEFPPASVTKIMTMLLSMEAVKQGKVSFDDPVTISERAASMGGSQMFMEAGEQQTLETLLRGVSICSANDACVACAEYIGGTEEIFVEKMNRRAKELGMKNTHFVNTNGLPVANHYTSAYDIGIMSRELLKFDEPKEWFRTWQTTVQVGKDGKKKTELGLTNTNRLIKLYPGADGIKTGFTQDAGYCLSGSATKGDLTLIAVVLGCESTNVRWKETMRLLDYGFASYDCMKAAEQGQSFGKIAVEKGAQDSVAATIPEEVRLLIRKGEKNKISKKVILKEAVAAPVCAGDPVGELILYRGKKELERHSLVADRDISKAGLFTLYIRMIKELL